MLRLKIGLIGCGMVAQVMHLPHLTELSDRIVKISFPSPFVKNMPTTVEVREQEVVPGAAPGTTPYVERRVTASYEEAFKRELCHFHDCVTTGATPLTSGAEAREDTRLMIDIIRAGLR